MTHPTCIPLFKSDAALAAPAVSFTAAPIRELSPEQLSTWSRFQQNNPSLDSPFFRPEFALAVAAHCDDVEVAVAKRHGCDVGYFPIHREPGNTAQPVGRSLSDFHGIVAPEDTEFSPAELIRQCRLKALHFNHLLTSQPAFAAHHWITAPSQYMNLSHGFEHYQEERRKSGSKILKQARRKARKIEREVGSLRFVPHEYSDERFQTLIDWKIAQYRRIRSVNHLAESWRIDTLRRIALTQSTLFSGMLSSLYAGDRLIAIHLGILSGGVLHCWFPTYSRDLAKYSPGLIFWLYLAQEAERLGITRIDLGKGRERFKRSLGTGTTQLAEGSVDLRPAVARVRQGLMRTREWIHSSVFRGPVRGVIRGVRCWTMYRSW